MGTPVWLGCVGKSDIKNINKKMHTASEGTHCTHSVTALGLCKRDTIGLLWIWKTNFQSRKKHVYNFKPQNVHTLFCSHGVYAGIPVIWKTSIYNIHVCIHVWVSAQMYLHSLMIGAQVLFYFYTDGRLAEHHQTNGQIVHSLSLVHLSTPSEGAPCAFSDNWDIWSC